MVTGLKTECWGKYLDLTEVNLLICFSFIFGSFNDAVSTPDFVEWQDG
jgi:hypothetical protein